VSHPTFSPVSADSSPRGARIADARLYLCTDARTGPGDLESFLHAAYAGGVDIIQLRDKSIGTADELAALEILARAARAHGKHFAVNDRADVASLVGADVFHVGQQDLTPAQARSLLGDEVVIGRSTHTVEQAQAARLDPDVDYFCTGPIWETPTKPGRAATGLGFVGDVAQAENDKDSPKPWFAIGGIDEQRLPQVLEAGAQRIVVVRAITQADDPEAAARRLRAALP
jgi:thiamine-phosphate pyrophosphorylase